MIVNDFILYYTNEETKIELSYIHILYDIFNSTTKIMLFLAQAKNELQNEPLRLQLRSRTLSIATPKQQLELAAPAPKPHLTLVTPASEPH